MVAAWLSLHLWDHYDYTRNGEFLAKRAYPVMKEAAECLLDYLVDDGKGHLVTGPSLSPENRYSLADGTVAKLCMGPTMDTEITRALFTRTTEAGRLLGIDDDFRKKLSAARDRLPPLAISKHGQLQEWLEDYDESDPGHRHVWRGIAAVDGWRAQSAAATRATNSDHIRRHIRERKKYATGKFHRRLDEA